MDKRRSFSIKIGFFFLMMGLLLVYSGEALASPPLIAQRMSIPRDYIISIQGEFDENNILTNLDPRKLRVGRGDNVTWINESKIEVKIKFGKGTQCKQVSIKALGWNLEPEKCYETKDALQHKGSATIRFKDIGLYTYEIEFVSKERKEQGIIHVQTEDR